VRGGRGTAAPLDFSEGATMSSFKFRVGLVVAAATFVAGAIAVAQDRQKPAPADNASSDVFNSIDGRLIVTSTRPEGARVEKGEVVCELDPTELQDRVAGQALLIRAREGELRGAALETAAAALAVTEYAQGAFIQDLQETEGSIKLAESKLARAEDKLDWCRRMFEKGYASMAERRSEELALRESVFSLERAQSKKLRLMQFTKPKTTKSLEGELEAARARELLKQAELERERSVQKSLAAQVARCKVSAPVAGRVHYITPIGPGAVVRDGQLLFRIVPDAASSTDK
jgi:HlyD family secretion protein